MFEESPAFVVSVFTRVPALSVLGTCIGYTFAITGAKYLTNPNKFIVLSVEGCSPLQQEERCHRGSRRVGGCHIALQSGNRERRMLALSSLSPLYVV